MHLVTKRPRVRAEHFQVSTDPANLPVIGGLSQEQGLYGEFGRLPNVLEHCSISSRPINLELFVMSEAVGYRLPPYNTGVSEDVIPKTLSPSFLSCMCHNLIYLVQSSPGSLPGGIPNFLKICFSCDLPISAATDCFLVIALSFGMPLHRRDLSVMDKRSVRVTPI